MTSTIDLACAVSEVHADIEVVSYLLDVHAFEDGEDNGRKLELESLLAMLARVLREDGKKLADVHNLLDQIDLDLDDDDDDDDEEEDE